MSVRQKYESRLAGDRYPFTEGMNNWDGTYTESAVARILELLRGDTLRDDFGDGTGRIRPSAIGHCLRAQLLSYHGEQSARPVRKLERIMLMGTFRHRWVQAVGLSMGWLTDVEVPLQYPPWMLAGRMDGLQSDGTGLEFKSTNSFKLPTVRKLGRPLFHHEMQVNAYMIATGIERFSVVYEERNFADFEEFRVGPNLAIQERLRSDMDLLLSHLDADTLPPILPDCQEATGAVYNDCFWKEACFRA